MKTGLEIERKYLIEFPDFEFIRTLPGYSESEIEQIYLECAPSVTERVRRRAYGGRVEYTHNVKIRLGAMTSRESEEQIGAEEYRALSLRIEKGATPLYKKRYTFSLGALVAEIDVYPFFSDFCVMEIELPTEATVPEIPDFIRVIKEVTGEKAYSNRALAHRN